jgi:hypothetical protein
MSDGFINVEKTAGPFDRGGPGGPGRPKGARSKLARVLDNLATDDAEAVYSTVKDMALGGDLQACREILSRAWPVPKGRAIEFDFPVGSDASAIPQAIAKVLEATATGEIIPAEAQELVGVVEAYRKSLELADIEQRLAALEKQSAGKQK